MKRRILLIDFDRRSVQSTRAMLEAADYEVVVAATGKDASEALAIGGFAVVILEPMIPGQDGFKFCQAIKRGEFGPAPRVFVGSRIFRGPRYRAMSKEAGADGYFERPQQDQALMHAIEKVTPGGPAPTITGISRIPTLEIETPKSHTSENTARPQHAATTARATSAAIALDAPLALDAPQAMHAEPAFDPAATVRTTFAAVSAAVAEPVAVLTPPARPSVAPSAVAFAAHHADDEVFALEPLSDHDIEDALSRVLGPSDNSDPFDFTAHAPAHAAVNAHANDSVTAADLLDHDELFFAVDNAAAPAALLESDAATGVVLEDEPVEEAGFDILETPEPAPAAHASAPASAPTPPAELPLELASALDRLELGDDELDFPGELASAPAVPAAHASALVEPSSAPVEPARVPVAYSSAPAAPVLEPIALGPPDEPHPLDRVQTPQGAELPHIEFNFTPLHVPAVVEPQAVEHALPEVQAVEHARPEAPAVEHAAFEALAHVAPIPMDAALAPPDAPLYDDAEPQLLADDDPLAGLDPELAALVEVQPSADPLHDASKPASDPFAAELSAALSGGLSSALIAELTGDTGDAPEQASEWAAQDVVSDAALLPDDAEGLTGPPSYDDVVRSRPHTAPEPAAVLPRAPAVPLEAPAPAPAHTPVAPAALENELDRLLAGLTCAVDPESSPAIEAPPVTNAASPVREGLRGMDAGTAELLSSLEELENSMPEEQGPTLMGESGWTGTADLAADAREVEPSIPHPPPPPTPEEKSLEDIIFKVQSTEPPVIEMPAPDLPAYGASPTDLELEPVAGPHRGEDSLPQHEASASHPVRVEKAPFSATVPAPRPAAFGWVLSAIAVLVVLIGAASGIWFLASARKDTKPRVPPPVQDTAPPAPARPAVPARPSPTAAHPESRTPEHRPAPSPAPPTAAPAPAAGAPAEAPAVPRPAPNPASARQPAGTRPQPVAATPSAAPVAAATAPSRIVGTPQAPSPAQAQPVPPAPVDVAPTEVPGPAPARPGDMDSHAATVPPAVPPPPVQAPAPPLVRPGELDEPVRALENPAPTLPPEAAQASASGRVFVNVLVGPDGSVKDVKVMVEPGYGMGAAARDAVRTWKYSAPRRSGQPARVWKTEVVEFRAP